MLPRLLFLLVLAANVGVAAWLALGTPTARPTLPPSDPGVSTLVLLSEREQASPGVAAAELADAPLPSGAAERCASLGPFPSQSDLRRAMNALTPVVRRIQFRESRTEQSRGFIVYLPAQPTRDEALSIARRLSAQGVRDYYVVTAGDAQNTISLGLFRDRGNAERRRAEIASLGFDPRLDERTESLPVYWLDYAVAPDAAFDWRTRLPDFIDLRERTVACF